MKTAYFDCFSGVSGDMALGALLACDNSIEAHLRDQLLKLGVSGWEMGVAAVYQGQIAATKVNVRLDEPGVALGRGLCEIRQIIGESGLSEVVVERSLAVFGRLAQAEAKIYGTSPDQVHFHEVGAIDAMIDVVGTVVLLEALGIERMLVSSLPCGYGEIYCLHGVIPSPGPATIELLRGFDVHPLDIEAELVTPTGAAIVSTLGTPSRGLPQLRLLAAGYGAGERSLPGGRPNVLRVIVGEAPVGAPTSHSPWRTDTVAIIETNIDDRNPQDLELLMEHCLNSGALDFFFTPIVMKKSCPAVAITVMCAPDKLEAMARVLFVHSGTFGMRVREQERYVLDRSWQSVRTPFGEIRVKLGRLGDSVVTTAPEYADCKAAAIQHGVPVQIVHQSALMQFHTDCVST